MVRLAIFVCSSFLITSCVTNKDISKNDIKKDSINIETNKILIDTIYQNKVIYKYENIDNEIIIPCDTAKLKQSFKSGPTSYKITKEKGQVKIVFKRDSSSIICENQYKLLYRENNSLKSQISTLKQTNNKEVTRKPFFANLWQISFFIILIFWILGITPKFIIAKII